MKKEKVKKIASKIIAKWLRKGNMARAMRDILPHSGLTHEERNEVAELVHHVVRFKKLYDYALEKEKKEKTPENYIHIFKEEKLRKYAELARKEQRWDISFSASEDVAKIMKKYPKFADIVNREPKTHLSVNISQISRNDAIAKLEDEGINAKKCNPETCILTDSKARYSSLVKDGFAIVQDSSSQHVSKLVSSLGSDIVDYCAGSGGKSFTIKFFNSEAKIYVHDINDKKIGNLFARAEKMKIQMEKFDFSSHELVMVDAPCSGLGSASRNPDAKYAENLKEFPPLQMEIIEEASKFVKLAGYLVYVVCTFNPDETYKIVEQFLEEHGEFEELELAGGDFMVKERRGGFVTTGDVMYVSILRKVSN